MRRIALAGLVAGVSLALAGCGASGSGSGGSTPPTDGANAGGGGSGPCSVSSATGEVAATIAGNAFDPGEIALTVGQTVTFTNEDAVPHTVTLDDGACDTDTIAAGASAGMTFSEAGSYPFHCTVHPTMTGTFTVS